MRIKTQAILITEETYPIAVACLAAGFAAIPFGNVDGYWLVINAPGAHYERPTFDGDPGRTTLTVTNFWIHPKEFVDQYKIINQKPGRKPEGPTWVECEKAMDVVLKEQLDLDSDSEFDKNTVSRSNTEKIRRNSLYGRQVRRPLAGYYRG